MLSFCKETQKHMPLVTSVAKSEQMEKIRMKNHSYALALNDAGRPSCSTQIQTPGLVQFVAYDCLKAGLAIVDPATLAAARL
jgi:hypothetical protein